MSDEFYSLSSFTIDVEHDILRGGPYGGAAIFYQKSINCAIEPVSCGNCRLTTAKITCDNDTLMLIRVYMPTDYGGMLSHIIIM